MIEVHILPGNPHVNEGTSGKTGKPYRIVEQAAFAIFPDGASVSFSIQPPRGSSPYPQGKYTLAPGSLYVRDGKLQLSPVLLPVGGGAK